MPVLTAMRGRACAMGRVATASEVSSLKYVLLMAPACGSS